MCIWDRNVDAADTEPEECQVGGKILNIVNKLENGKSEKNEWSHVYL